MRRADADADLWWRPNPSDIYLNIVDLRRIFMVSATTIRTWIREQGFPKPAHKGGRHGDRWRYTHVRAWLQGKREFDDYVAMLDAITGMDGSKNYDLIYRVADVPDDEGVQYTFTVRLSYATIDELREKFAQGASIEDLACEAGLSRFMLEYLLYAREPNRYLDQLTIRL